MSKKNTPPTASSSVAWDQLEDFVRDKVQDVVQQLLDEEVSEFLGRQRYERPAPAEKTAGYRNGYGKPRKLTLGSGTIEIRRPRVRDVEEQFVSRVLPFFNKRTKYVNELLPQLYLHGLAMGDFDMALKGLLGDDAPVSASTIARLKEKWLEEYEDWNRETLEHLEPVYLWADGVYVKAGLEKEKAALLVIIAGLRDGSKVVLSVHPGRRESVDSWSEVLRDLSSRGLEAPKLVIADGHLGIWGAVANVYPDAQEQRCWNHRMLNVFDKLPKRLEREAKTRLRKIVYAESREEAEQQKEIFQDWSEDQNYPEAGELLDRDWERMMTFFSFPKEHWIHLRTTNVVESPFSGLRLRTGAARRFKKVQNATAIIWKLLLVAESRFKTLRSAHLLDYVYRGEVFVNGERERRQKRTA